MFSAALDLKELREYKMHFLKKARKIVSHFNISVAVNAAALMSMGKPN